MSSHTRTAAPTRPLSDKQDERDTAPDSYDDEEFQVEVVRLAGSGGHVVFDEDLLTRG